MIAKKLLRLLAAVFWIGLVSSGAFAQRISAAEYFWNNDPGQGNGISIPITAQNLKDGIDSALSTVSQLPSPGLHIFNLRLRDANGLWGPIFSSIIQVSNTPASLNPPSVSLGELYVGTDPGFGNATPLIAFNNNFVSAVEAGFFNVTQNLLPGQYGVGVRFKDASQNWSATFQTVLTVETTVGAIKRPKITQGEYFITNDPGFGNGTPLIAFNGSWDEPLSATVNTLANSLNAGTYQFGVRFKDNSNNWGPNTFSIIEIVPRPVGQPISLSRAEYFWGNDPGPGNGTSFWTNGNIETLIAQSVQTLMPQQTALGAINFGVRFKDVYDNWSATFNSIISVEEQPIPNGQGGIAAAEYFWNSDPGEGNGTPLVASDGNYNRALEAALDPSFTTSLPDGVHFLWVRFKDNKNVWGPKFGRAIDVSLLLNNNLVASTLISPSLNETNVWINPTFRFRKVNGATAYIVQYSTNSTFATDLNSIVASDSFQVAFGLQYSSLYYWRVRATSPAGVGPWSSTQSFTTRAAPRVIPAPSLAFPTNNASGIETGLTLDWLPAAGTVYQAELDTVSNFSSPFKKAVSKNRINSTSANSDTEWFVSNLYFNRPHYWRVRIIDNTDTSAWVSASFRTLNQVGLVGPLNSVTSLSPTLDWQASNSVVKYEVQADTTILFNSPVLKATSKNYINTSSSNSDTEFTLSGLLFNKKYFWRVRAINLVDTSDWNSSTFTTEDQVSLVSPNTTGLPVGVTFDWRSLPGVNFYQFEIDSNRSFLSPELKRVTKTYINSSSTNSDTEHSIEGLLFNTQYFWRVRAYNLVDTSAWSEVFSITTDAVITLSNPINRALTPAAVNLDWNSYRGSSFYDYQLDTSASFNSALLVSGTKNYINTSNVNSDTEQRVSQLLYGKNYYWRVRPRHLRNTGSWSAINQFDVQNQVALVSPNIGTVNTGGNLSLDWASLDGSLFYQVQWSKDSRFLVGVNSATKNFINSSSSNQDTEHSLTNLPSGVWWWRVRAYHSSDTTEWSDGWWFSTNSSTPAIPTNIILISPNDGATNLPLNTSFSWNQATNADAYEIQVATDVAFSNTTFIDTVTSLNTIPALDFNTNYFWRVRGLNTSQFFAGNWSTIRSFTTRPNFRLEKPLLVSPVAGANQLPKDISFSWSSVTNATEYLLIIDGNSTFTQSPLVFSTTNTNRQVTNFNLASTWYWKVIAISGNDTSLASDVNDFTIRGRILQTPPVLQSPVNGAGSVSTNATFTWGATSLGVLFYQLELSKDTGFTQIVAVRTTPTSSLTVSNLAFDSVYYWRVRTFGAEDTSEFTPYFGFRVEQEPQLLGQPVNISPTNGALNTPLLVSLVWSQVANANGYEVQIDTLSNFLTATTLTGGVSARLNVNALAWGKTHYWRVRAFGFGSSFGRFSVPTAFKVRPATPDAPVLRSPSNNATVNPTQVDLDWDTVNNGKSFVVQWTNEGDFLGFNVWTDTVNVSNYILRSLDSSSIYRWRVQALNEGQASTFSSERIFTTQGQTPLDKPVIVQLNNTVFPEYPVAVWTNVDGATFYEIQVTSVFPVGSFTATINTTSNFIDLASLNIPIGLQLKFEVRAVSGSRVSLKDSKNFTLSYPPLDAPTLVTPANLATTSGLSVGFIWNKVFTAETYEYRISLSPAFTVPQSGIAYDTTVTVNGLAPLTTFYWSVRATRGSSNSPWSTARQFTTGAQGGFVGMPNLLSPRNGTTLSANQRVILGWSLVPGPIVYEIQLDTFPDFRTSPALTNSSTTADFTFYTKPSRTWYWRVRARLNLDSSLYSPTWSFNISNPIQTLSRPNLIAPVNGANNQNTLITRLIWSQVEGANAYEIQVDTTTNFRFPSRSFRTSDTVGFVSQLKTNKLYYWRVRAIRGIITSAWTSFNSFTTSPTSQRQRPIFPTQISPQFGAVSQPLVGTLLVWRKVRNAIGYKVEVSGGSNLISSLIADSAYSLPVLTYNEFYRWRVKTITASDSSEWSGWFGFTSVDLFDQRPELIRPANNANVVANTVLFQWKKTFLATSYQLEYDTLINFSTATSVFVSDTNYNAPILQANKAYFWRVKAYLNSDSTDWAFSRRFSTLSIAYNTPTLVNPGIGAIVPYQLPLIFRWTGNDPDSRGYQIRISKDSLGTTQIIATLNTFDDNLLYSGALDVGIKYFWRVRAFDRNGQSPWTTSRSFKLTVPGPPNLIAPANNSVVQANNILFNWSKVPRVSLYQVEIATDIDFLFTLINTNVVDTFQVIPSLISGLRYYWRVTPLFASSVLGTASPIFTFEVDPLGLDASLLRLEPFLYPNPSSGNFKIGNAEKLKSGYLLNAQGKKVLDFKLENASSIIELGELPSGVYQVVLSDNDKLIYRRRLTVVKSKD